MYIGGKTVADLRHMTDFAKKCEEASYQYIRPKLQPTRYAILSTLEKVEKSCRKEFSKTYLRPLRVVDEWTQNVGEDKKSFISRVVNDEMHDPDGKDWIEIYRGYILARNEGNLEELQLEIS